MIIWTILRNDKQAPERESLYPAVVADIFQQHNSVLRRKGVGKAVIEEAAVARVRILYWHEIPSVVEAQDDEGGRHKEQLSSRFQELIDTIAMRKRIVGTDAYLEGWHRGRPEKREGAAMAVAKAVALELEATFDEVAKAARES